MNTLIDSVTGTAIERLKSDLLARAARRRSSLEPDTDREAHGTTGQRDEAPHRCGERAPAWSALHD